MKNKIVKGLALCLLTTLVIGCNPKKEETPTPTVDNAKIKAELQAMETKMADSYNSRSMTSDDYYAEDATSFSQNKAPLVGKSAIDQSIKEDLATFPKGNTISFAANEVFPSNDGNQVVEIGSYKVVDSTGTKTSSGNYMSVFVKKDGKYTCIRDMGASDMPKKEEKK